MKYADDIQLDIVDVSEINEEELKGFSCGNDELDRFLHDEAKESSAKTCLFIDTEEKKIVAYTSIACSAIMYAVEDDECVLLAPDRFSLAPAIEIKYFAVHEDYKHLRYSDAPSSSLTLSCNLFRYIVQHVRDIASNHVGAEYIVLYSVPKAISFYKRNLFNLFEDDMVRNADPYLESCQPMYMEI